MAGFFRVSFEGEYFNQIVVNIFHYRSALWPFGSGNPFDDVLGAMDDIILKLKTPFLAFQPNDYTLENVKGVGYSDDYSIVTSSPLVRNVHAHGVGGLSPTNGAAGCAILGLRCGEQTQINGVGSSKRNRGYLALGPVIDENVDSYSHLAPAYAALLDVFGQAVDDPIVSIGSWATLQPVRIHEKWTTVLGVKVLVYRTYSDVLGYTVNRVASYRRSRQPEA